MQRKGKLHAKSHERSAGVNEATIRLHIELLAEGGYIATSKDVPAEVSGRKVTLPHHSRDVAEGTLRAILREAGIDIDDFLKA